MEANNPEIENKPESNSFQSILFPIASLALALYGQWLLLETDSEPLVSAAFFAAAIVVYLLSLFHWPPAALVPQNKKSLDLTWRPLISSRGLQVTLILSAALLAIVSYRRFSDNALDRGFWTWIAAIILFLAALVHVPGGTLQDLTGALAAWWRGVDKRIVLLLTVVVLVAIFFRYYRLQGVPLEMTSDHAEKILDVQDVLDGKRPIFFPRNTGRELFQFYLTAGIIHLTGLPNGHLALKAGTALFGVIAIPFTFLLGLSLYGNRVGLLASFFLAVSHWHVAISRVGLRFPFTAAFITPVLYFLLRAMRDNRRNDWLLVGLFLGIGMHTYTTMRMAPLLIFVLVSLKLLSDGICKLRGKAVDGINSWEISFWENGFLAFIFSLLLMLPLIRYMADDPRGVWIRSLSRAQPESPSTQIELATQFLENSKNALLMFNVQGDLVPMNTIPNEPALALVSGALFVLGLAYLVWRLVARRDRRSVIVLVSLFFLLLPSILSLAYPAENPSFVRTGGAVGLVMIIAAIPLVTIMMRILSWSARLAVPLATAVVLALILTAVYDNYTWYFRDYDEHIRYSIWNTTELGAVLKAYVEEGADVNSAYHIPYPHWVDTRNIGINAGYVRWNNAIPNREALSENLTRPKPQLYFIHPDDADSLQELRNLFPSGSADRYDSARLGKDFNIFRVPASTHDKR